MVSKQASGIYVNISCTATIIVARIQTVKDAAKYCKYITWVTGKVTIVTDQAIDIKNQQAIVKNRARIMGTPMIIKSKVFSSSTFNSPKQKPKKQQVLQQSDIHAASRGTQKTTAWTNSIISRYAVMVATHGGGTVDPA